MTDIDSLRAGINPRLLSGMSSVHSEISDHDQLKISEESKANKFPEEIARPLYSDFSQMNNQLHASMNPVRGYMPSEGSIVSSSMKIESKDS